MSSFATPRAPHMPPAKQRKALFSKAPPPKFCLPETTPTQEPQDQLRTPATAHRPGPGKWAATTPTAPVTGTASQSLFPLTPEPTPQKSPRQKRKRLEDFFRLPGAAPKLLPNQSVVGSGRKPQAKLLRPLKAPIALDFAELSGINKDVTFEEDYDDELPESPTRGRRRAPPAVHTPGLQMITDEKVRLWHGLSFKNGFSSDESDSESTTMQNPFLESTPARDPPATTFGNNSRPAVNYDTHLELVNHRTGERKVELLLESQRQLKPKKLDFSGVL